MSSSRGPKLTCRDCGLLDEQAQAGDRCPKCETVLVPARVLEKFAKDPLLGRVVGGKYAVVSVLGVGGFGAVYRAVQEPVGRHVALKVVHAQHVENADMRARFFREAKVVARLDDPAVVTLFDYGDEPSTGLYMVFELVAGRNLGQVIKEGPQDPVWVAHVLLQVLRALSEAHDLGMIHRDIKPANIMVVERQGRESVRLLDFGIAKVEKRENHEASLETREGMMLGTPQYMSPEQAKASVHIDARSDLYSLGVVGYALVAGRNPFERASIVETIMAHVADPVPPLPGDLGVPPALEAALAKALEKEPAHRYGSAAQMADAIQSALPNVAFPSLTYEYRAPPSRSGPSLLGAALDGPRTPTPSVPEASPYAGAASGGAPAPVSALAEPGPSDALLAPMPGPDVSEGGATEARSLGAPGAAARRSSTPLVLGVLLLLVSVGGVAGAMLWQERRAPTLLHAEPIEAAPAGEARTPAPAPLPDEPVARAAALAERGEVDAAERTLSDAIAAARGRARAELYARAEAEAALAPLLSRPVLRALAPAAPPPRPAEVRRAPAPKPRRAAPPPAPKPRAPPPSEPDDKLEVPEF